VERAARNILPDDGGSMSVRSVCKLLPYWVTSYPRKMNSSVTSSRTSNPKVQNTLVSSKFLKIIVL
jgi:hypothetical protein